MKISPLVREMSRVGLPQIFMHTGQHYDESLSRLFFQQLGIPEPDVNLEVGSASQAVQTAEIMRRFEPLVIERRPDLVLVVGDVNSTMACALVAAKLCIPVVHVNAAVVITDSGGVQEKTIVRGVPCRTVRDNTERPVTIEQDTNRLVGTDPLNMLQAARAVLHGERPSGRLPELCDGKAAQRIVEVLRGHNWPRR